MSDDSSGPDNLSLTDVVSQISPQTYQSLKSAIELGKWSDGRKLTKKQLAHCMQAVILYETEHVQERDRVGYIEKPTAVDKPAGNS